MTEGGGEKSGVEFPHVIDMLAHDRATDEVALVMRERRPWSGSDFQLFQLQEKINAYLSFALDGELAEAYPALVSKPIRLQLECISPPDERVVQFLSIVREQVAFRGINFQVHVNPKSGTSTCCGQACGCGSE